MRASMIGNRAVLIATLLGGFVARPWIRGPLPWIRAPLQYGAIALTNVPFLTKPSLLPSGAVSARHKGQSH